MDTGLFLDEISKLSANVVSLATKISASDSILTQSTLSDLVQTEEKWMKLFAIAGIAYFTSGYPSAQQASYQISVLRQKISEFKEVYLSGVSSAIRTVFSDTDATSSVVKMPSYKLDRLISAGKLSGSGSVYNAAVQLETELGKWRAAFPNASSPGVVSESTLMSEASTAYMMALESKCPFIHADARLIGTLLSRQVQQAHAPAGDEGTMVGLANVLSSSKSGFSTADALTANESNFYYYDNDTGVIVRVDDGGVDFTNGLVIDTRRTLTSITLVIHLQAVGATYFFAFNGGAQNGVTLPVGGTLAVETAAGVAASGTRTYTRVNTGAHDVSFTFDPSTETRLVVGTTVMTGLHATVYSGFAEGQIITSSDGISAGEVTSNARFRDLIGGGREGERTDILNVAEFSKILGVAHVLQNAHGDNSVYNVLNLHYINHLQTSSDSAASLDAYVINPLKNLLFWFGLTANVGVSKSTRIALWRVYHPMICDMVKLAKTDGTVSYHLTH
jgi:hypothetical protein